MIMNRYVAHWDVVHIIYKSYKSLQKYRSQHTTSYLESHMLTSRSDRSDTFRSLPGYIRGRQVPAGTHLMIYQNLQNFCEMTLSSWISEMRQRTQNLFITYELDIWALDMVWEKKVPDDVWSRFPSFEIEKHYFCYTNLQNLGSNGRKPDPNCLGTSDFDPRG